MKKKRRKRCKHCGELFTQFNSLQATCSPKCALEWAKTKEGLEATRAALRRETRDLKRGTMDRKSLLRLALKAAKRYVRARDRVEAKNNGKLPGCCSCGNNNPNIQYAAGHYKTAGGHPEIALNEFNMHLQCNHYCNMRLSGNIEGTKNSPGYSVFMVGKYGQDYVDSLDGRPPVHYTSDELEEIRKLYNEFALELERRLEQ